MKFRELISAFRDEPAIVAEVLSKPCWREPYGEFYGRWEELVAREERSALDAELPPELPRAVAALSQMKFIHRRQDGWLGRERAESRVEAGAEILRALEVYSRYGGSIIEEVNEHGSAQVDSQRVTFMGRSWYGARF